MSWKTFYLFKKHFSKYFFSSLRISNKGFNKTILWVTFAKKNHFKILYYFFPCSGTLFSHLYVKFDSLGLGCQFLYYIKLNSSCSQSFRLFSYVRWCIAEFRLLNNLHLVWNSMGRSQVLLSLLIFFDSICLINKNNSWKSVSIVDIFCFNPPSYLHSKNSLLKH